MQDLSHHAEIIQKIKEKKERMFFNNPRVIIGKNQPVHKFDFIVVY
jgi:hypothetical protein